nr:immunoglobulin heavy chain junction region [Mus musculus]
CARLRGPYYSNYPYFDYW